MFYWTKMNNKLTFDLMLILENLAATLRLRVIVTDREKQELTEIFEFLVQRAKRKSLTYKVTNYVQFKNKNPQTCNKQ